MRATIGGTRHAARCFVLAAFVATAATVGCARGVVEQQARTEQVRVASGPLLSGTSWQLVQFRASDRTTATLAVGDRSYYTVTFSRGSRVSMQLGCQQASGTWDIGPASDTSGVLGFNAIIVRRVVQCSTPTRTDPWFASDARLVESYVLRDGQLRMQLPGGGFYLWEPLPGIGTVAR